MVVASSYWRGLIPEPIIIIIFFFSAWPLFLNIIAILHPLPPSLSLFLSSLFFDHLFFTTVNRRCSTNLDYEFLLNDIYAPCKFSTATLTDVLEREREFNTFRSRRDLEQFWDETSEWFFFFFFASETGWILYMVGILISLSHPSIGRRETSRFW